MLLTPTAASHTHPYRRSHGAGTPGTPLQWACGLAGPGGWRLRRTLLCAEWQGYVCCALEWSRDAHPRGRGPTSSVGGSQVEVSMRTLLSPQPKWPGRRAWPLESDRPECKAQTCCFLAMVGHFCEPQAPHLCKRSTPGPTFRASVSTTERDM